MPTFVRDLRYSLRKLMKSPAFTGLAVITLALGIGMTTAIFSVVYGVLLHPLPYNHAEQIVELHEVNSQGYQMQFADPNFEDIRSQTHSLAGVAEYAAEPIAISGGLEPTRTTRAMVSHDFFPVLQVNPVLGRGFSPEDQRFGAAPVALVGYGYWKQYLGGTTNLSSKTLIMEDRVFSVVGVLPKRFNLPLGTEIFVPREIYERYPSRTAHNWHVIARLREGVPVAEAHTELQTIAGRLKEQYGQDTMMTGVSVVQLLDGLTADVRPALWILLAAVGLLLVIACANVANLLLVQSASRRTETAIRFALGASRSCVTRQLVVESLLLSLAGGIIGVLAAFWGLKALLRLSPGVLVRTTEVSLSAPVLLFSVGICLLVACALGIFTGIRSTYAVPNALAAGGRSQSGTFVSQRISRVIVSGQLAITLTLLTGAALLGRSLFRILSVNPGFLTEHVITMNLPLSDVSGETAKVQRIQFLDGLFERLRTIPGVQDVGGTSHLPLIGFHPDGYYLVMNPGDVLPSNVQALEQMFHDRTRTGDANYSVVTAAYFRVLGIPLLRGRLFDSRDAMDTTHVALISEALARQKWPGQDPLGRQIEFGNMDGDLRLLTVVGVVGDVRDEKLERPGAPAIYVNYQQRPQTTSDFNVVIRVSGDPAAVIAVAHQTVRDLDPNIPPNFATLDQIMSGSVQTRRFNLFLIGVFAGTALLLAIAGMYGIMAYSVACRTNEIGVRMALGASRNTILGMVFGQGLLTAATGVVAGTAASFIVTRSMASLLFGLSPTDPLTFAAMAVLLMFVSLMASYFPALRAIKTDPAIALKCN